MESSRPAPTGSSRPPAPPARPSPAGPPRPPRCAAAPSPRSAGWWRRTRRRWRALVTREIGKPMAESLGEVQEISDTCDFFISEGRRLYGQTVPSEMPDKQLFTFREPIGVATIITAGNFPVAVPAWYLVPALLCGNAVVWKPADYTPALGEALTNIFNAGGLPDGVLNLVQADGPSTFEGLERCARRGAGGQGRLHRLVGGGQAHRRAVRPPPAAAVPRAGRQEPAGGDARRRPRPRRGGRAVQRLRHRRPALHLARHGDGARVDPRRLPRPLHRAPPRRPRSATRPRTCSTAR